MRKATLLITALALLALAGPAFSATFWNEQFSYANGALTAVTANWTTHPLG